MTLDKRIKSHFVIIMVFLSSLMAASFVVLELRRMNETLNQRAELIINELGANIGFSLFVGNYEEVEKRLNNVLQNKDIVFCVLKDNYDQIIYEIGDKGASDVRVFEKSIFRDAVSEQDEEMMLGIKTETKEQLGTVQINVSNAEGKKTVVAIVVLAVIITCIMIITAFISVTYFLNKVVALPVKRLVEGTKKIADGDFSYKVPSDTDDEIGLLGQAFNRMTMDLSNTLVSKDFMDNIFASTAETLLITDENGRITMANKAAEEMIGLPEKELKGMFIEQYFDEIVLNEMAEKSEKQETLCFTKNGEVPVLLGVSFLNKKENQLNGYVCSAVNIASIKESERKLKNALTKIEKYTEELEETNNKLEELDKLKSSFLSMVSHELRTPLTSIKGYLAFLLRGATGPITDTQKDYLESISRNSERLLNLINDLVDMTKMEKGTFAVNKSKSDIIPILNKCIKEMGPILEANKIKIITSYESDSIELQVDEYRISQVFINLINNAVKFSPKNGVITVGTQKGMQNLFNMPSNLSIGGIKEKMCCLISIKDQGIGMEKKYVERVFDRFYQIEDIDTRKYQGLGLGLNIAKNIVEAHGGIIWADSKGKDKGTVFEVLLPIE